ncbi:hypothetical protein K466DRAFT_613109, partial [Polyporus arcularius HHB13444]
MLPLLGLVKLLMLLPLFPRLHVLWQPIVLKICDLPPFILKLNTLLAGQAARIGVYPPAAALPSGWDTAQLVPGPPQVCPPPGGWPAAPGRGWTGQLAPVVSGPSAADALAMLRSANEYIIQLSQQLMEANQKIAYFEAQETQKKKGGRAGKVARGNEDDGDQPPALSGMKLKVRSDIRAYALNHCPWPPPDRARDYTYTPDIDPLDPFERYVDAAKNEPRIEAVVVQLRNFFPEEYLPYMQTQWMQRQFTEVINTFKSHIVSAVKGNPHIVFGHIKDLETNKHYWGGTVDDRYPAILFPIGESGNEERLGQNPAVAKACRVMVHGRTAGNGNVRVRGNTNSSKWKLRTVTSGMLATVFVLLRYVLSDFISFERKDYEGLFFEYHRKILESMHKRSMKRLFLWLDIFVFGPGSDMPIHLTPEPCAVDDIILPEERDAHGAHAAASFPPMSYPPQQAHLDDNYLSQSGSDYPHNSYSDNHGPFHYATTDVRSDGNNYYDNGNNYYDNGNSNGGIRNLLDNAHGVCDAEVHRPVHDIRNDWQIIVNENAQVGDAEFPRHEPGHDNVGLPAHHDLTHDEPRLSSPVSDAHAHGDGPVSRHVHFAQSTLELSGDRVGTGTGSTPAASSSHADLSSRVTHAVPGASTAHEQAVEADPVVQLTTATADLALQPAKKKGSRKGKEKEKAAASSTEDPEQASDQPPRRTRRRRAGTSVAPSTYQEVIPNWDVTWSVRIREKVTSKCIQLKFASGSSEVQQYNVYFVQITDEERSWWHRRDCSTCRKLRMVKLIFEASGKNKTGSEATPVSIRHAATYAQAARPTSPEGVRGRGNTPDADLYVATSEGRLVFATTNHRERLEPALFLPARMDVWIEFRNAYKWQAELLARKFFPSTDEDNAPIEGDLESIELPMTPPSPSAASSAGSTLFSSISSTYSSVPTSPSGSSTPSSPLSSMPDGLPAVFSHESKGKQRTRT